MVCQTGVLFWVSQYYFQIQHWQYKILLFISVIAGKALTDENHIFSHCEKTNDNRGYKFKTASWMLLKEPFKFVEVLYKIQHNLNTNSSLFISLISASCCTHKILIIS